METAGERSDQYVDYPPPSLPITGWERLPCGAWAFQDGIGLRCNNCLTIYGSMACPCTREKS